MNANLQIRLLVFALSTLFVGCVKPPGKSTEAFALFDDPIFGTSSNFAPTSAAAASAPKDKRVVSTAKIFVPFVVRRIENESVGKFKMQVRVAFNSRTGLDAGQSGALLQLYEDSTSNRYLITARYDGAAAPGFNVLAQRNDTALNASVNFPGSNDLDLQLEQAEQFLNFSARIPPDLGGTGAWTPIAVPFHPASTAPNFRLMVGMSNVEKKGRFYFTDFRLEGDGIGGAVEGPILVHVKTSADAILAAEAKLLLDPPEMAGATTNLDAALTASAAAQTALTTAIDGATLQASTFGDRASKMLLAAHNKLQKTRDLVAELNVAKANSAHKGLENVLGNQEGAMGNLLGAKVGNLSSKPDIFTWHAD